MYIAEKEHIIRTVQAGDGGDYNIPGLEKIKPFGGLIWGVYTIYSTESLLNYTDDYGNPKYYVLADSNKKCFYNRVDGSTMCAGKFKSLMSEEEQVEFEKNIDKILELLGL